MKRTSIQLADRRELIYFDERDDAVRDEIDRRDLPPQPTAGELRYDPLVDEWVAIAGHRQTRTFLPATGDCPLCPSTPDRSTEIPAYDYDVVVFENRFPSFNHRLPAEPLVAPTPLSPVRPAAGRCEVVCFTPDHNASFAALPPDRVRTVVTALADRTAEREAKLRVVGGNEHWTAYVPAAARWPFEVHVVPHRHVLDLTGLTDVEVAAFAPVCLDVLRRCDRPFRAPLPYIAAWHQAPVRHPDRDLAYLHLQLTSVRRAAGKLKYLAGSESAMGAFVNDVRPERAAAMLREVDL